MQYRLIGRVFIGEAMKPVLWKQCWENFRSTYKYKWGTGNPDVQRAFCQVYTSKIIKKFMDRFPHFILKLDFVVVNCKNSPKANYIIGISIKFVAISQCPHNLTENFPSNYTH